MKIIFNQTCSMYEKEKTFAYIWIFKSKQYLRKEYRNDFKN